MNADFFRARQDQMIDLRHPPATAFAAGTGQVVTGEGLFGPTLAVAGAGVSAARRPRPSIRLMASLLNMKHAYNLEMKFDLSHSATNHAQVFIRGYATGRRCRISRAILTRNVIRFIGRLSAL